jgi:hypothetical protein
LSAELPGWAIDDPAIAGATRLLRRVPERMVHGGVVESSNFREDEIGRGLSLTIWESESDLADIRRFNESFGVVCVAANVFREAGAVIVRVPLVGNLNHLEVFPRFSSSPLKKMKLAARWVHYPDWVVTEHRGPIEAF